MGHSYFYNDKLNMVPCIGFVSSFVSLIIIMPICSQYTRHRY
jgi:hypothetical protein